MRTVVLGSTGLEVSAIGLGCMTMSESFGPVNREESLATLQRAVELGVSFLDTSDIYGVGSANEKLLADFMATAGNRDSLVLATKFGAVRHPETGDVLGLRGDAEYVRDACDASLKRLAVDRIDLYYLHHPDPKTPIEETVGAMAELVNAGKVSHIGLSNIDAEQLRAAHAVHPITAVQEEWSLFTRTVEASIMPTAVELGVGVVPYSPLGRGFLTGVYTSREGLAGDDYRRMIPRFSEENSAHNTALLDPIMKIAGTHNATAAQVALAWLTGQSKRLGISVVPIPGTKRAIRIEENAKATEIDLTDDELALLEPIAGQVRGSSNPELSPEMLRLLEHES
jgi:aryl-alcohol dehydrogenase-like predicted oxidoreductase